MIELLDQLKSGRSLWIGLHPDPDTSATLPPDAHCTVAFLGKDLSLSHLAAALATASHAASTHLTATARVSGTARFTSNGADGDPHVLLLDSTTIRALRQQVIADLAQLGLERRSDFDYTPHITLSRIPRDRELVVPQQTRRTITFDRISVVCGEAREYFR